MDLESPRELLAEYEPNPLQALVTLAGHIRRDETRPMYVTELRHRKPRPSTP